MEVELHHHEEAPPRTKFAIALQWLFVVVCTLFFVMLHVHYSWDINEFVDDLGGAFVELPRMQGRDEQSQHMHISLIFDENRLEHGMAVFKGVVVHTKQGDTLAAHLLVPNAIRDTILAEVASWEVSSFVTLFMYDHTLCFKHTNRVRDYANPEIHVSALCKLHLADILPETVKQVLYLDNDIAPADDPALCWQEVHKFAPNQLIGMIVDMGAICQQQPDLCWPIGYRAKVQRGLVCGDEPSRVLKHPRVPSSRCPWSGEWETLQFNGGVMLLDLEKMRKVKFTDTYVNFTQKTFLELEGMRARWAEQDFINNYFREYDVLHPMPCGCNYQWSAFRRAVQCPGERIVLGHGWHGGIQSTSRNSLSQVYFELKERITGSCVGEIARPQGKSNCIVPTKVDSSASGAAVMWRDQVGPTGGLLVQRSRFCPLQTHNSCRYPQRNHTIFVVTWTAGKEHQFSALRTSINTQRLPPNMRVRHVVGCTEEALPYVVQSRVDAKDVFVMHEINATKLAGNNPLDPCECSLPFGTDCLHAPADPALKATYYGCLCETVSPLSVYFDSLQQHVANANGWVIFMPEDTVFTEDAFATLNTHAQTPHDLLVWQTANDRDDTNPPLSNLFRAIAPGEIEDFGFMIHTSQLSNTAWGNTFCGGFRSVFRLAHSLHVRWVKGILTKRQHATL